MPAASSSDRVSELLEAVERAEQDPVAARHRRQAPGLFTLPAALRGARVRVGSSVLVGAVVLLVLVLTVVAARVQWAERAAAPTPIPHNDISGVSAEAPATAALRAGDTGDAGGPSPSPAATTTTTMTTTGPLYVHVIGAVRRAGVVKVDSGARVSDVVQQAGGMSATAEPGRLNLARLVSDGERIWVPVKGAEPPVEEVPATPAETVADRSAGATEAAPLLVDLNTADSTTLQTLPGVGPVTAEAIETWRVEHGRFSAVEELIEVSGIGPRTMERLRPQVTVTP